MHYLEGCTCILPGKALLYTYTGGCRHFRGFTISVRGIGVFKATVFWGHFWCLFVIRKYENVMIPVSAIISFSHNSLYLSHSSLPSFFFFFFWKRSKIPVGRRFLKSQNNNNLNRLILIVFCLRHISFDSRSIYCRLHWDSLQSDACLFYKMVFVNNLLIDVNWLR